MSRSSANNQRDGGQLGAPHDFLIRRNSTINLRTLCLTTFSTQTIAAAAGGGAGFETIADSADKRLQEFWIDEVEMNGEDHGCSVAWVVSGEALRVSMALLPEESLHWEVDVGGQLEVAALLCAFGAARKHGSAHSARSASTSCVDGHDHSQHL